MYNHKGYTKETAQINSSLQRLQWMHCVQSLRHILCVEEERQHVTSNNVSNQRLSIEAQFKKSIAPESA